MSWLLPVMAGGCVLLVIALGYLWNFGKAFCRAISDRIARSL